MKNSPIITSNALLACVTGAGTNSESGSLMQTPLIGTRLAVLHKNLTPVATGLRSGVQVSTGSRSLTTFVLGAARGENDGRRELQQYAVGNAHTLLQRIHYNSGFNDRPVASFHVDHSSARSSDKLMLSKAPLAGLLSDHSAKVSTFTPADMLLAATAYARTQEDSFFSPKLRMAFTNPIHTQVALVAARIGVLIEPESMPLKEVKKSFKTGSLHSSAMILLVTQSDLQKSGLSVVPAEFSGLGGDPFELFLRSQMVVSNRSKEIEPDAELTGTGNLKVSIQPATELGLSGFDEDRLESLLAIRISMGLGHLFVNGPLKKLISNLWSEIHWGKQSDQKIKSLETQMFGTLTYMLNAMSTTDYLNEGQSYNEWRYNPGKITHGKIS